MRTDQRLATALVGLLIVLASPAAAPASASTVRDVTTGGTDTANTTCSPSPCKTIAHAISVAQAGDTISIGPGTFKEELTVGKPLNFVGAGSGTASEYDETKDTLIDGSASEDKTIFAYAGGSFSGLRIYGGKSSGFGGGEATEALVLQASDPKFGGAGSDAFTLSDVVVAQPQAATGSDGATVTLEAVSGFTNTTTITGLTAIGVGGALDMDLTGSGALNLSLSHSTLTGGQHGEATLNVSDGNAAVSDTTVSGEALGASVYAGGQLTATRDSFTGRPGGLKLRSYESRPATATLRDSLVAALPTVGAGPNPGVLLLSETTGSSTELTATNSTIVASGKGATAGLQLISKAGATATAQLANTIAYGFDPTVPNVPDVLAEGPGTATVTAANSGYSIATAQSGATITPAGSAGNITGNPDFTNPAAGDFTLTSSSPLLERGDLGQVLTGELDLAGNPRTEVECGRTLNPDIGAYELQRAFSCPLPAGGSGSASSPNGPGNRAAVAGKTPIITLASISAPRRARHRKHAKAGKLSFTLNEAATVDVTLRQLVSGHLRKQACIAKANAKGCKRLLTITTARLEGKAGKNTVAFPSLKLVGRLKPATYELVLVAVSAQRTPSTSRTVKFTLH